MNQQITAPLATTVKAVYVQPGDKVPAGKVLMQLDDMNARAQLAAAEAAVKKRAGDAGSGHPQRDAGAAAGRRRRLRGTRWIETRRSTTWKPWRS